MAKPSRTQIIEITKVQTTALGIPATTIKLSLGGKRSAFVFTMTDRQRDAMDPERFRETAQRLGDMVHPSPAVMVVLPGESPDLRAYEVRIK